MCPIARNVDIFSSLLRITLQLFIIESSNYIIKTFLAIILKKLFISEENLLFLCYLFTPFVVIKGFKVYCIFCHQSYKALQGTYLDVIKKNFVDFFRSFKQNQMTRKDDENVNHPSFL